MTNDRRPVIYLVTNHFVSKTVFRITNTQETTKRQVYTSDVSRFPPLHKNVKRNLSKIFDLSTCPAKNQAGCIDRVVDHSHENQKFYLFKIAINEKCQKPKLTVKVIMVAMATAVKNFGFFLS